MALPKVALDTDILSAMMRRQPTVIPSARAYLREHLQFHFSIITQYEILRGSVYTFGFVTTMALSLSTLPLPVTPIATFGSISRSLF